MARSGRGYPTPIVKPRPGGLLPGYSDDFVRANSNTSAGPNWTNRRNTVGVFGNAAYPATTDAPCLATYNSVMAGNDMRVDVTVGTSSGGGYAYYFYIILGANTAGQSVILSIAPLGLNYSYIYSKASAWTDASTARATSTSAQTWSAGDLFTIKRVGNLYTALHNDVAIDGLAWTDSGDLHPRDSSHRIVGMGGYETAGVYTPLDAWAAYNL